MSEERDKWQAWAEGEIAAVTKLQGAILESMEEVARGLEQAAAVEDMTLGQWVKIGMRRGWVLSSDSTGPVWCYHCEEPPTTRDEQTLDAFSVREYDDRLCLYVVRISREAIDNWESDQ